MAGKILHQCCYQDTRKIQTSAIARIQGKSIMHVVKEELVSLLAHGQTSPGNTHCHLKIRTTAVARICENPFKGHIYKSKRQESVNTRQTKSNIPKTSVQLFMQNHNGSRDKIIVVVVVYHWHHKTLKQSVYFYYLQLQRFISYSCQRGSTRICSHSHILLCYITRTHYLYKN